jgi:hypothetical protein
VVTLVGRNNTGISVNAGDRLRFNCTGFIDEGDHNLGEIIADGDGRAPDGHLVDDGAADSPHYPFPGKTRYALAGGILDASMNLIDRFMIGRFTQFVATATGQIALFANDDKPGDNHSASDQQTPWVVSIDVTSPTPPPPPNTPGLRIADIQIVQIAQNLQGDCVLVAGKTTAVRAFVTVLDPSYAGRTEVDGTVEVIRVDNGGNMTVVGTFPALNPGGKANAAVLALAGDPVNSSGTSSSLNFDVPGSVLPVGKEFSHYTFKVRAFLMNQDRPGYMDVDQRSAGFVPGFGLSVSLVLVSAPVNGSPPQVPTAASLNVEQTEYRLPLSDGSLQVQPAFPPVVFLAYDVGDKGDGYWDVLSQIKQLVLSKWLVPANPSDLFLVLVPPNPSPLQGATVELSDGEAIAIVSGDPSKCTRLAAHGLNHTLGLKHAASPGCSTPNDIDATLPIAADAPGWTAIDSLVEAVGTPAAMGSCDSAWPTAEEFSRGYRRLATW